MSDGCFHKVTSKVKVTCREGLEALTKRDSRVLWERHLADMATCLAPRWRLILITTLIELQSLTTNTILCEIRIFQTRISRKSVFR